MRDRINYQHMLNGVEIVDPTTTWIDANVTIAADATIFPESWLAGTTTVGAKAIIGPRTTLMNVKVAGGASVIESN